MPCPLHLGRSRGSLHWAPQDRRQGRAHRYLGRSARSARWHQPHWPQSQRGEADPPRWILRPQLASGDDRDAAAGYGNLLDGMLVAINANDRLHFNMQYNNIPVAAARKMGLIGMKTFADGSMYGKQPMFSNNPSHVIRTIGNASLPSHPLIQYSLTTPGIGTLIVGTGHIDDDPKKCQLGQNLIAAQIKPTGLSMSDRRAIEKTTATVQDGKTNYFQLPHQDLTPPRDVALSRDAAGGMSIVKLTWQTAYAGDEPISHYEVLRDGQKIGSVNYRPQVDKTAFLFEDKTAAGGSHKYVVATVDAIGRRAEAGELTASAGRRWRSGVGASGAARSRTILLCAGRCLP